MGAIKLILSNKSLRDRELHNSRAFVDLSENIHIHFREYRFVFSLQEYFEFADIINKSTSDVRNYLMQNPDYEEQRFKDDYKTLMIACGRDRQMKFLRNSPRPNKSFYFDDKLSIELQEEDVTDEIHVHYRDLRLAFSRETFKDIASAFTEAAENLESFEKNNQYQRQRHPDREIDSFNQQTSGEDQIKGVITVDINRIKSYWYDDISNDKQLNASQKKHIAHIKAEYKKTAGFVPIVLSPEGDDFIIVDGHNRVRASIEMGLESIDAVVVPLSFSETELIRMAENKLKKFDVMTNYQFHMSDFFQNYLASRFNTYYRGHFSKSANHGIAWFTNRILQKTKKKLYRIWKGVNSLI